MLLCFLGTFSALKFSVRDVFESVLWDLLLRDEMTRVGGVLDSIPHPLEKASELIRRQCAPCDADLWILMVDELLMLQPFPLFPVRSITVAIDPRAGAGNQPLRGVSLSVKTTIGRRSRVYHLSAVLIRQPTT